MINSEIWSDVTLAKFVATKATPPEDRNVSEPNSDTKPAPDKPENVNNDKPENVLQKSGSASTLSSLPILDSFVLNSRQIKQLDFLTVHDWGKLMSLCHVKILQNEQSFIESNEKIKCLMFVQSKQSISIGNRKISFISDLMFGHLSLLSPYLNYP